MRFSSFEVEGFKNIVANVRLEHLGSINVLHGENNVGKSNVLRAMEVFFVLLRLSRRSGMEIPVVEPCEVSARTLEEEGLRHADLFNYAVPQPIKMSATLAIDALEMQREGIEPLLDASRIDIDMSVARLDDSILVRVESFRFADGTDIAREQPSAERKTFVMRFAAFLSGHFLGRQRLPRVDVDRHLDEVVNALYDAHVSSDRKHAMIWDRFTEAMASFGDILGDGRFMAVLPREANAKPRLLFETSTMRIPLHALGSGVQAIIGVLGAILTSGASVVFVEEPEVHLRWALQERLRDVLVQLVGKEGAPSQLVLTSHSGAFEVGDSFFLMQRGDHGPSVERRPIDQAAAVVGQVAQALNGGPDVPTHVSADGILRLPDRVRNAVGVERGGGVSFVDKGNGVVEMMADGTFLRLAGLDDDNT